MMDAKALTKRRITAVFLVLLQALLAGWGLLAVAVVARALGDTLKRLDPFQGKPLPALTEFFINLDLLGEISGTTMLFVMAAVLIFGGVAVWRATEPASLNFRLIVVVALTLSGVLAELCLALICVALPFISIHGAVGTP